MNANDISNSFAAMREAKRNFHASMETFLENAAEKLRERFFMLSPFPLIESSWRIVAPNHFDDECGLDINQGVNLETVFPIPGFLRETLDGKFARKDAWLLLLGEHGFPNIWEEAIKNRDACAFMLGLEDRRVLYRDNAKRLEDSERRCPGHGDAYNMGRCVSDRRLKELRADKSYSYSSLSPVVRLILSCDEDGDLSAKCVIAEGPSGMCHATSSGWLNLESDDHPEDAAAKIAARLLRDDEPELSPLRM